MTEPSGPSQPSSPQASPTSPPPRGDSPSFVKLAMRNMVRKGRQSLVHFGLTALGLSGFLMLIAWLGRPQPPGG